MKPAKLLILKAYILKPKPLQTWFENDYTCIRLWLD